MTAFPFIAGILASSAHVVSGPDHLAAVTPLVVESRHKTWKIGFLWGVGHLLGMLLIGLLFLTFKDRIPVELISHVNEKLVALILIALGFWTFYRLYRPARKHTHPHVHTSNNEVVVHIHKHEHKDAGHFHTHDTFKRQTAWSSLGIGIIHGFAGVSHFILLFPVLGFTDMSQSLRYLAGFAVGTVLAMTLYALLIGWISEFSARSRSGKLLQAFRLLSGVFAVVVGIFWLYQA